MFQEQSQKRFLAVGKAVGVQGLAVLKRLVGRWRRADAVGTERTVTSSEGYPSLPPFKRMPCPSSLQHMPVPAPPAHGMSWNVLPEAREPRKLFPGRDSQRCLTNPCGYRTLK